MRQKIKKLILEGVDANIEKNEKSKEMNKLITDVAKSVGITKKDVRTLKDVIHYKGMGWGSSCLEIAPKKKGEPKRYTDRVTPIFRRLVELIETCRDADELELISEYLQAAKARGVNIVIDSAEPKCTDKDELDNTLNELNEMQSIVCQKNDYITQDLAEQSESIAFAPKGKYKSVVELATKIKQGKDVDEKIEALLTKNNMHNAALETIVEESDKAPSNNLENITAHSERVEKALQLVNLDGDDFVFDLNGHSESEYELVEDTLKILANNEESKKYCQENDIEIYKEGKTYIATTARIPNTMLETIEQKGWYISLN